MRLTDVLASVKFNQGSRLCGSISSMITSSDASFPVYNVSYIAISQFARERGNTDKTYYTRYRARNTVHAYTRGYNI